MTRITEASVCWSDCWSPALFAPAGATSRIKDLANVEGVRQNQLIGYGLVVGLNGTGDTLNNPRSPSSRCTRCWNGSASTSAPRRRCAPATSRP